MSMHDRAAQFAPFAALVGYNDAVAENASGNRNRKLVSVTFYYLSKYKIPAKNNGSDFRFGKQAVNKKAKYRENHQDSPKSFNIIFAC
jgi:hypothetical protein